MNDNFRGIIGYDSIKYPPPSFYLNNQITIIRPCLSECLKLDQEHIELRLNAIKKEKLIKFNYLYSPNQGRNRCCTIIRNSIQIANDVCAYAVKNNINNIIQRESFFSIKRSTVWKIDYLDIDKLSKVAVFEKKIIGKCFLLILVISLIVFPIICMIVELIWLVIIISLFYTNHHAYHQMLAPINKSIFNLNLNNIVFLSAASPFVFVSIIFLIIAIKALHKKIECQKILNNYKHIHKTDFFKKKLIDEILASDCLKNNNINENIPNLIIEYL